MESLALMFAITGALVGLIAAAYAVGELVGLLTSLRRK